MMLCSNGCIGAMQMIIACFCLADLFGLPNLHSVSGLTKKRLTDVCTLSCCRAGPHGEVTYPELVLAPSIRWHGDVQPGAVMLQEHDVHLLEEDVREKRRAWQC